MKRAPLALILVLGSLLNGCGSAVDRLPGFQVADATFYPREQVSCEATGDCARLVSTIDGWLCRHANERGPAASVTFHVPGTADGTGRITRSGGRTWIAVVTFIDGSQIPIMVGCGAGIMEDYCSSGDPSDRSYRKDIPLR
jgi:hypothetical protein